MHSEVLFPFLYSNSQNCRFSFPPLRTTCTSNLMQAQEVLRVSQVLKVLQNSMGLRQVNLQSVHLFVVFLLHFNRGLCRSSGLKIKISEWMVVDSESLKWCKERFRIERERRATKHSLLANLSLHSSLCSSWKQKDLPFLPADPLIFLTVQLLFVLSFLHLLKKRDRHKYCCLPVGSRDQTMAKSLCYLIMKRWCFVANSQSCVSRMYNLKVLVCMEQAILFLCIMFCSI